MKIRPTTDLVYGNNNLTIKVNPSQIWEVVKESPKSVLIKYDFIEFRIDRNNFSNLWEEVK